MRIARLLGERLNDIDGADLKFQLRELFGQRFAPGANGVVGVVSPQNASEVRKLILCTRESGLPLVPRGAGTSPYAAATALRGVIVTFEHMNHVLKVDELGQLARVEPGVIWRQLIEDLRLRSLMPRVYPSSAAVSTVGGFVAQGGIGVGSFQYGDVAETVQAARLVAADGEMLDLAGETLGLAIGAEGRTGVLVELALRVQPLAGMEPLVAVFNRVEELEGCLAEVARAALPLWSVSLMDRAAVNLQSRLRPAAFDLPQGRYAALFSFRSHDRLRVLPKLRGGVLASGGKPVPVLGSHEAWIDRFMGLQGLGTTVVPMQFRVPISNLARFIQAIPLDLRRTLAFEGVVADVAKCVTLRFFLLEPSLHAAHNLRAARKLLVLAKQHGGQVYATGLFFTDEAEAVFGVERLDALVAFRQATDPHDRLNPGKAFDTPPAEPAMRS